MRKFSKEWLKASNDDLMTIEHIIHTEHLTHIVAFHSQQAIEKSLKALIEDNQIDIPKIHKLVKLQKILENKINLDNNELLYQLDELYIESRYPGDMGLLPYGKPSLQDAQEFYNFAKDIFEKVCKILNITIGDLNGK